MTSPEIANVLKKYVTSKPLRFGGPLSGNKQTRQNRKDFEELQALALKDMGSFNKKLNDMKAKQGDSHSAVRDVLAKAGLSKHITDENKIEGDETMNESYKDKFNAQMKKFGIDSLDDLKTDAEKKAFFKAVDKSHDAVNEEKINEILPALAVGAAAAATGALAYKAGGAIYKGVSKIKKNLSAYGKGTSNPANEEDTNEGGPGSGPQKTNWKPLSKNHSAARLTVSTSKAKQIKSWLADHGETYPVAIDDNGSGQITIDDDGEDGSSYEAGQAIAKKFGVKVVGESKQTQEGGPGSGPQFSSATIKKAYGILNDPRYKGGNYSGAAKAIEKLGKGLSDHPDVKNAMKRANEEQINEVIPAVVAVGALALRAAPYIAKAGKFVVKKVIKNPIKTSALSGGSAEKTAASEMKKEKKEMKQESRKYHDTKPGSIQDSVMQMQVNEQKVVTVKAKELSAMIETYLAKGGVSHNLSPAINEWAVPAAVAAAAATANYFVNKLFPPKKPKTTKPKPSTTATGNPHESVKLPLKAVREFIDTYNRHFLTNYAAEEFIEEVQEGGPGSGPQKGGKKYSAAQIKKAYAKKLDIRKYAGSKMSTFDKARAAEKERNLKYYGNERGVDAKGNPKKHT